MAQGKAAAAAAEIDDQRLYWVTLTRRVERPNGVMLLPGQRTRVSGRVLREIGDAVSDAQPAQ
jgi:hypothetical protein